MSADVTIIATGVANTASLEAAFARLGCSTVLATAPREVAVARRLVLPGVGAFSAGMEGLRQADLVGAVRAAFEQEVPFLGICLGMQMLFEESEESPGVAGLGLLPGKVRRLPADVSVPQFGWNSVRRGAGEDGMAYFANSYVVTEVPEGWDALTSEHGCRFVAALARGRRIACQFHPELSGAYGKSLLQQWLAGGASC